jgi:hypothetical protein
VARVVVGLSEDALSGETRTDPCCFEISFHGVWGNKGRLFGGKAALSPDGRRICLEQEPGRLALYDVDQLRRLDEMTFPERVVYSGFSDDRRLVVMTADQTVYVFGDPLTAGTNPSN